jgi:ABC-type transport system involved in multi-copper enzyme maturation permease subunit
VSLNPKNWTTKFLAVVRYEILWNIRKKKFLVMLVVAFALTTLSLAGGHLVEFFGGQPVESNPNFVINSNIGLGGLGFLLFAIVTVMNTISGEFESGTIITLLSKPVGRTTVFLAKLFAAFLTLSTTYGFLMIYMTVGGSVVYGPQNNLHLVPLSFLGSLFSTLIWIAVVLFFGALFKSSLIAAFGTFGIWLGTNIIGSLLSVLAGLGWILTYIPGNGSTGYVGDPPSPLGASQAVSVSTGTDSLGPNLINYILHPSRLVTFYKIDVGGIATGQTPGWIELYSQPLSTIIWTSIAVALVYFIVFVVISWYLFRRAQIAE